PSHYPSMLSSPPSFSSLSHCYAPHRDLPSFPTRRSSDLCCWAPISPATFPPPTRPPPTRPPPAHSNTVRRMEPAYNRVPTRKPCSNGLRQRVGTTTAPCSPTRSSPPGCWLRSRPRTGSSTTPP